MKVLLQRVIRASVTVDERIVGSIAQGLLLLTGFGRDDSETMLRPMAEKLANLRIFSDEHSKFNLSLLQTKGAALVVPQFTLFADTSKGRRPEFFSSMPPEPARELFDKFVLAMRTAGVAQVARGEFGAHMHVDLLNDGPVTMMLEM